MLIKLRGKTYSVTYVANAFVQTRCPCLLELHRLDLEQTADVEGTQRLLCPSHRHNVGSDRRGEWGPCLCPPCRSLNTLDWLDQLLDLQSL